MCLNYVGFTRPQADVGRAVVPHILNRARRCLDTVLGVHIFIYEDICILVIAKRFPREEINISQNI